MSKTITSILKAAAGDILADETLNTIEEVFNAAVEEKSNTNIEAALIAQDAKHASKLKKVMEAVDADRAEKLKKVVSVVTENHTKKLKAVIAKYEKTLNEEARNHVDGIVDTISEHLNMYLDEKIPVEQIQEAVNNKRAMKVVNQLREALAVDLALSQDSIKAAVVDGKTRLDESTQQVLSLQKENTKLVNELINTKSRILLEEKTKGLPTEKKNYLMKVLVGKPKQYIEENYEYMLNLFDFEANNRREVLKEEAIKNRKGKDIDIVNENYGPVTPAPKGNKQQNVSINESYMSELSKY